ncbi:MAG TPA: hypothetical protein DEP84_16310, partial [Chloroflexi bacterium]|nr:hypothetical protein [Chloroflexota bacterium]
WNTETGRPRLLVAKGCSAGGRLVATDLLLLDPELPGESSLGVSLSSGLSLSQPLWCTAGRILFLQHGPKSTDLVQVRLPGQDPQRLTRADRLVPLACFSGG